MSLFIWWLVLRTPLLSLSIGLLWLERIRKSSLSALSAERSSSNRDFEKLNLTFSFVLRRQALSPTEDLYAQQGVLASWALLTAEVRSTYLSILA